MSDDVKALDRAARIKRAREYAEYHGVKPWTEIIFDLLDLLEASVQAPAVDREALARQLYIGDNWGVAEPERQWDDLLAHPVEFERYRARADAIIASGILQDAAVLDKAAYERGRSETIELAREARDFLAQQTKGASLG